jgi:hypothetical protein
MLIRGASLGFKKQQRFLFKPRIINFLNIEFYLVIQFLKMLACKSLLRRKLVFSAQKITRVQGEKKRLARRNET